MAQELGCELCVIGGGAGGLAVAEAAASLGVSVILVEKGPLGGARQRGAMPAMALLSAASRAHAIREGGPFGMKAARPAVEFHRVNDHIQRVAGAVAPNISRERLAGLGIRVLEGHARFLDRRTVAVGEDIRIAARRFVIATGSVPAIPAIPGLDRTPYLTSDTVFDSRALPKQLVVLGAGRTGLELAQAFRRLGAEVTVLDAGPPLAGEDPECVRLLCDALRQEGLTIRAGVAVERVRRLRNKVEITLREGDAEETIEASDLLVAAGRTPVLDGLGLDAARIAVGPAGIAVNRRMRTRNRRVYAIGDAAGGRRFGHLAELQAATVIRHALFWQRATIDPATVPRAVFTDPELAHVGLNEADARRRHRRIRVLRWPFHENDRAQAERRTAGQIKIVTDRKGTVLGATIVGASAGELIGLWTMAVGQRMNIRLFAGIVLPYPTLVEAGRRAALIALAPRLTARWLRRLLGWLRSWG